MKERKTVKMSEQFREFPSMLTYLSKHFEEENSILQHSLLNAVDESDFSLHEWVESLMLVDRWLENDHLILSIENNIEYVSCAAAAVRGSSTLCHLPSVVNDFLEQYGCELAVKK